MQSVKFQAQTIEYRRSRYDLWTRRRIMNQDLPEWLEYFVELGFEIRLVDEDEE